MLQSQAVRRPPLPRVRLLRGGNGPPLPFHLQLRRPYESPKLPSAADLGPPGHLLRCSRQRRLAVAPQAPAEESTSEVGVLDFIHCINAWYQISWVTDVTGCKLHGQPYYLVVSPTLAAIGVANLPSSIKRKTTSFILKSHVISPYGQQPCLPYIRIIAAGVRCCRRGTALIPNSAFLKTVGLAD